MQSNKPSVLTQSLCAGRNAHHHLGSIVAKKNNGIVGEKSSGCTPLPSLAIFLFGGRVCVEGEIHMLPWSAIQKFRIPIDYIEVPVTAFFSLIEA